MEMTKMSKERFMKEIITLLRSGEPPLFFNEHIKLNFV